MIPKHRVHWRRLSPQEAFGEYAVTWRRLLHERTEQLDPYLDPSWYQQWWEHFGNTEKHREAWIIALMDVDKPIAILPMMFDRGALCFMGNQYSHRHGIATSGHWDHVARLLVELSGDQWSWYGIKLDKLDADGPEAKMLATTFSNDEHWSVRPGENELWARPGDKPLTPALWQQHLNAQSKESRRKRRRIHQRAQDLHTQTKEPFELQRFVTPTEARQFARHYLQILNGSWKAPELSRGFLRGICELYAEMGCFQSYVLMHKERAIACQLGLILDRTFHCYKTAYIQQYATCSPGVLVMDMAIADVVESGEVDEIDLLTGDNPYKRIWCNHTQKQVTWIAGVAPPIEAPPGRPSIPPNLYLTWRRERDQKHPMPKGECVPTTQFPALTIAIASGTNVGQVSERNASPTWRGLAWVVEGRIQDVAWLEEEQSLHLPPPYVRAEREGRLGLLSTLLQSTHASRLHARIPRAHIPTLRALGFEEEGGRMSERQN